jgi:hypothetical protein
MAAAEHANRILTAWIEGDTNRLELEIEGALLSSVGNVPLRPVEDEEQELLESVALHLRRSCIPTRALPTERLATDFALLRHLGHRSSRSLLKDSCAV